MSKRHKIIVSLTVTAIMAALSIVFERFLGFTPASNTSNFRITFADVPIILTSLLVSPIHGAVCGVVSDVAGCFFNGYAPFPLLTLAPFFTGLLPGLLLLRQKTKLAQMNPVKRTILLSCTIVLTHVVSSMLVTTFGLSVMRGVGFAEMFIMRLPFCLMGMAIDSVLVSILYKTIYLVFGKNMRR